MVGSLINALLGTASYEDARADMRRRDEYALQNMVGQLVGIEHLTDEQLRHRIAIEQRWRYSEAN